MSDFIPDPIERSERWNLPACCLEDEPCSHVVGREKHRTKKLNIGL